MGFAAPISRSGPILSSSGGRSHAPRMQAARCTESVSDANSRSEPERRFRRFVAGAWLELRHPGEIAEKIARGMTAIVNGSRAPCLPFARRSVRSPLR